MTDTSGSFTTSFDTASDRGYSFEDSVEMALTGAASPSPKKAKAKPVKAKKKKAAEKKKAAGKKKKASGKATVKSTKGRRKAVKGGSKSVAKPQKRSRSGAGKSAGKGSSAAARKADAEFKAAMKPRKTRQQRLQAEIDELKNSLRKDERELVERDSAVSETGEAVEKPAVRRSTRTRFKPENYYREFASDMRRHYYDDMTQEEIDDFEKDLRRDVRNRKVLVSDTESEEESSEEEEDEEEEGPSFVVPNKFL